MTKNIIIIILTIMLTAVFPLSAEARSGSPSYVIGAKCSTPDNGDELDEGFVGPGYENSWTESGGTLNEDRPIDNLFPPGSSCREGLFVRVISNIETLVYWDRGSTFSRSSNLDIIFDLYVVDGIIPDAFENIDMLIWDVDTTMGGNNGVADVRMQWDGSNMLLYGDGADLSTSVALTGDTWYVVTLHMDATAANSYLQVVGGGSTTCDAASECTFTRRDAADGRYLMIGGSNGAGEAGDEFRYNIGYVYINSP